MSLIQAMDKSCANRLAHKVRWVWLPSLKTKFKVRPTQWRMPHEWSWLGESWKEGVSHEAWIEGILVWRIFTPAPSGQIWGFQQRENSFDKLRWLQCITSALEKPPWHPLSTTAWTLKKELPNSQNQETISFSLRCSALTTHFFQKYLSRMFLWEHPKSLTQPKLLTQPLSVP